MSDAIDVDLLIELLRCHSTPGDEDEVAAVLSRVWEEAGWSVARHGQYALSAIRSQGGERKPRLLICAHMDSPGYTVDARRKGSWRVVPLGGAEFDGRKADALLKTAGGKVPVTLRRKGHIGWRPAHQFATPRVPVAYGDRVCFRAEPSVSKAGEITSPFLDNRVGCALLCEVARALPAEGSPFEVVLGATSCEEIGGFGAPVLARAVEPDVVICLDATYEDEAQGVLLGKGPVLTLSDASVILSPAVRDAMREWFARQDLPLQTEVYNYSGTDSKAFPHAGLPAPVFALLIASRGNHSPAEVASLADVASLRDALLRFALDPPAFVTQ